MLSIQRPITRKKNPPSLSSRSRRRRMALCSLLPSQALKKSLPIVAPRLFAKTRMVGRSKSKIFKSTLLRMTNRIERSSQSRKESFMNPQLTQAPIMKTAMLIRRPAAEVFEAFINPDITTKFWFTKSSARLEAGKTVQWQWEMYEISIPVTVKDVEPNRRIVIEWPGYSGPTTVEWVFECQPDGTTFVR